MGRFWYDVMYLHIVTYQTKDVGLLPCPWPEEENAYLTHCIEAKSMYLPTYCMSNVKAVISTIRSFSCMQSKHCHGQQFFRAFSKLHCVN